LRSSLGRSAFIDRNVPAPSDTLSHRSLRAHLASDRTPISKRDLDYLQVLLFISHPGEDTG